MPLAARCLAQQRAHVQQSAARHAALLPAAAAARSAVAAAAAAAAASRPAGRRRWVAAAASKERGAETGGVLGGSRFGSSKSKSSEMDLVDARQQVDIERLINACHELQDRVEGMEAQLNQQEERSRDRAVALRAILRDDKLMDQFLSQHEDGQLELKRDEAQEPWDSYRNSFTLLMSKGYLRAVEALRNRLMASEWELGLRPIALQMGVSQFEEYCAENRIDISFETLSELYDDPTDLRPVVDPHLRMKARAIITQVEAQRRGEAWVACTQEAQRLAAQFSEAEFISKIIPDPIEHGVVDALRKVVAPVTKALGG